jgi:hypothetical protein
MIVIALEGGLVPIRGLVAHRGQRVVAKQKPPLATSRIFRPGERMAGASRMMSGSGRAFADLPGSGKSDWIRLE